MISRRARCFVYALFGALPALLTLLSAFMVGLAFAPTDIHPLLARSLLVLLLLSPWIGLGSLLYVIANLGEVPRRCVVLNVVLLLLAAGGAYLQVTVWLSMSEGIAWAIPAILSGVVYVVVIVDMCAQHTEDVSPGL